MKVLRIGLGKDVSDCDLVFVSGKAEGEAAEVVRAARQECKLTVGEPMDFLALGGMVSLVVETNEVKLP